MIDRVFLAVIGFVVLWLAVSLPRARAADEFSLNGITSDGSFPLAESLSLESRQTFFFSTSFGWMQPTKDFLPTFKPVPPRNVSYSDESGKNSVVDSVDLRYPDRIYVGGEIGFLYGRSTGKYGVEYERGYVIGEIGNDKFLLRVGTSYERSNWRTPRWPH